MKPRENTVWHRVTAISLGIRQNEGKHGIIRAEVAPRELDYRSGILVELTVTTDIKFDALFGA